MRLPIRIVLVTSLVGGCGDGVITGAGDDEPACVPTGEERAGDGVDNDCDGIVDELRVCGDGGAPYATIGEAIAAAPDGGGVELCAGTYAERLAITGRSIRINGAGAVLDAGGAGSAIVVDGGARLTVAGLTIQHGAAPLGGGIRCDGAELTLLDARITGSRAEVHGGALHADGCAIAIEGGRLDGNVAVDQGGAIDLIGGSLAIAGAELTGNQAWRGGAIFWAGDGSVDDSTFAGNRAGWTGGAIHVHQRAPAFRASTVRDNHSEWEGGGFYLHQSPSLIADSVIDANTSVDDGGGLRVFESAVRLERNVISNNQATDGDGGGLKSSHVAGLYLDNQVTGNQALGAGGGLELDNDSSVVRGGVIAGNDASIGGGVHVMLWPWHDGLIEDVRIADNHAWRGGGLYLEDSYQPVTVRRVTITGNDAHEGAGVYTRGTPLVMSNSVIAGNRASGDGGGLYVDPSASYPWEDEDSPPPPIDPPAVIAFSVIHANPAEAGEAAWIGAPNLSVTTSIVSGHAGNAVTVTPGAAPTWRYNDTYPARFAGMADPTGGAGNLSIDPRFADPSMPDFHLQAGSACIDAGDPALADRDGSRADLGAYGGPDAP